MVVAAYPIHIGQPIDPGTNKHEDEATDIDGQATSSSDFGRSSKMSRELQRQKDSQNMLLKSTFIPTAPQPAIVQGSVILESRHPSQNGEYASLELTPLPSSLRGLSIASTVLPPVPGSGELTIVVDKLQSKTDRFIPKKSIQLPLIIYRDTRSLKRRYHSTDTALASFLSFGDERQRLQAEDLGDSQLQRVNDQISSQDTGEDLIEWQKEFLSRKSEKKPRLLE